MVKSSPRPDNTPTRASTGSSAVVAEGDSDARPGPARTSRERSIETPGTDAGEVERLARRLEAVSQRMADLLRLGVLDPSLAYAFFMRKGGQESKTAKTKAKSRGRGRAPTNGGAGAALDVSPPRPPPKRPPRKRWRPQ